MSTPLADFMRPKTLDEVVGQQHLLGENKILQKIIKTGIIPNMIFYGSSGIGKTTVARIIAGATNKKLHILNGTSTSTAQIKEIIADKNTLLGYNGILLYLDEIQYLNKKQQQSLLEDIENGNITLIASTTENPYFYIYNAILSRCTVFEFKPVSAEELKPCVLRAYRHLENEYKETILVHNEALEYLCTSCGGDVRKAINAVELSYLSADIIEDVHHITFDIIKDLAQKSSNKYDRDSDFHYDILSAFQKSIRGSDENAALHYLARLIDAGDIISICRRLLVIATEDIGLAYPNAIAIVKACVDSCVQLGLPEGRIPLAQAVILLCTSPKSNSAINAIDAALEDVRSGNFSDIPKHLKDGQYEGAKKLDHAIGYLYPHIYKNNYVVQQYLPDKIKDKIYYNFSDNKQELAAMAYRGKIKEGQ